jgi:UDP-glucuronate decarboxylase
MKIHRQTILVTGGAGFIGSHLCEKLIADGAFVVCVDSLLTGRLQNLAPVMGNRRFEFIERDVLAAPPRGLRPDQIYHLACAASPPHYQADPVHTMMTCVQGARNYLDLARDSGARFLLSSTSEVYGDPEVHPQREDYRGAVNITGPRSCYDEGKRAAEALVSDYCRAWGVDVRIARIFNTYGPRMRRDDGRVISNFIAQVLGNEPITIYGDGSQTRSFCYVDDMVRGLEALMNNDDVGAAPVNLGNPAEFTVAEVVELAIELAGAPQRIVRMPLPQDDPRRRRPDITRARTVLGWGPTVPLRAGMRLTMRAFMEEIGQSQPAKPARAAVRLERPAAAAG